MFLIPLTHVESVDLVIHALRTAGGEADCASCPVRKVCTKQCLAVADGIRQMVAAGTLPTMDVLRDDAPEDTPDKPGGDSPGSPHLRIVK